jgi:ribosomal protein L9
MLRALVLIGTMVIGHSYSLQAPAMARSAAAVRRAPLMCAEPTTAETAPATVDVAAMDGVVQPTAAAKPAAAKPEKREPLKPFAPAVKLAKAAMGEKELNQLRAKIIAEHTKVISAFVDTSESAFGKIALKRLFEAADADNSGTLDKAEIRAALNALGFEWLQEKQVDQIVKRGDIDENEVIDFEEFVKEAPRTLRINLVKLAKQNGHDLGFLA